MTRNKTQPTNVDVNTFIGNLDSEKRRQEAIVLVQLMRSATGEPPVMWGPSIIGFGTYHYIYESGREGDFMCVGFSPRKAAISLYIMGEHTHYQSHFEALGKYSKGKSCIYIKKLEDVDLKVLAALVKDSFAYISNKTWP